MVRMPALASRNLILKKRSDFTVGPFSCLNVGVSCQGPSCHTFLRL